LSNVVERAFDRRLDSDQALADELKEGGRKGGREG
jgi:hypothetical protein